VADFETKLRWLSERGNPVGAEELIERIEAELAGDPLVVVAKRREGTLMTKTQQSPTTNQPSRSRGPAWAVATFVAILAVAGLYLAFAGAGDEVADTPPPPTTVAPDVETMTDLEIIEAGVDALYSGDADRAVELFELPGDDDDWIRREAAYQAAIGGRLTLACTKQVTPGVFTCHVPYQNAITDAINYRDGGDTIRVVVEGGVIREFNFPEHTGLLAQIAAFLHDEGNPACAREFFDLFPEEGAGPPTADCANLILDNLDDWAAWYQTNS